MSRSTSRFSLYALIGLLLIVLAWWVGSSAVGNELLLPSPPQTISALIRIAGKPEFLRDLWATALRVIRAFLISYAAGLAAGAAAGLWPSVGGLLSPAMAALRTVPFISVSVLSIIWFAPGAVPVFVAFLMAFPIVSQDVAEGIKSVDRNLLEMSSLYKVPKTKMISKLYLPSIAPHLVASGVQALGISWKIVVSAEVLSLPARGIGGRMDSARAFLETSELFAWTLLLVAIGFATDLLLRAAMAKAFRRRTA